MVGKFLFLFVIGLLSSVGALAAGPLVVMRADSGISKLNHEDVVNIFLGRYRKLPDGQVAVPVDAPANSNLRAIFYRELVGKDISTINAYWARLHFTGNTKPPMTSSSIDKVKTLILQTPGGIGYLEDDQVDSRFVVVLPLTK
jgi:ABC-type phosphate transport system substrate-binding protein